MEKATDPNDYYRKARSYIMRQKMTTAINGEPLMREVEIKFKLPNFLKTTTFKNGKPFLIILFTGKKAWRINPDTGVSKKITGKSYEIIEEFAALGHPANTLTDVFKDIKLTEIEENGQLYYKLECGMKYKDLPPVTFYVNANTYLTEQLETKRFTDGTLVDYISRIDKYSNYKGVMIASETTVKLAGAKFLYQVTDYQLNVDIPGSEFKLPTPWFIKNQNKRVKQPAKTQAGQ
jgi:outer membrane lipoprotein-sorting protein